MTGVALYFVTGASGVGKTTLLKGVVEAVYPDLTAFYMDERGVPSLEEMNRLHGGPEQWQAAATRQWIEEAGRRPEAGLVVLEGSVRPSAVIAAARAAGLAALHITLIDCSHEERQRRLREDRSQPELNTPDMYAWAAYLRGQADALGLEILDTTTLTKAEAVAALAESIGRFEAEVGSDSTRESAGSKPIEAKQWMPRERWDDLVQGRDCPLCADLAADVQSNEFGYLVANLKMSRLWLCANQSVPGYCIVYSRRHVVEPYELGEEERRLFFDELWLAARAIGSVFQPIKMNYQILGNLVPHLHCHLVPRYYGDPAPGRPIDPGAEAGTLAAHEYVERVNRLREALRGHESAGD